MNLWRKSFSNLNRAFFFVIMSVAFLYLSVATGQFFPLGVSLIMAIFAVAIFRKSRRQQRRALQKM